MRAKQQEQLDHERVQKILGPLDGAEFIVEFETDYADPTSVYRVAAGPDEMAGDLQNFLIQNSLFVSSLIRRPSFNDDISGLAWRKRKEATSILSPGRVDSDNFLAPFARIIPYGGDTNLQEAHHFACRLRDLPGVRTAYIKPAAVPATRKAALVPNSLTPDFSRLQEYLGPAPEGIDANAAWAHPGGHGADTFITDLEGGWELDHEDLDTEKVSLLHGDILDDWRDHGTAVLGQLCAKHNHVGVMGIASDARILCSSIFESGKPPSTAAAIVDAVDVMEPGDVLLIELHRPGPRLGFATSPHQSGYIPIEWWPDDLTAIRYAVEKKGVIVVSVAGNGAEDLDDPLYDMPGWGHGATGWNNPFKSLAQSSGSILVGAGAAPGNPLQPDRSRLSFSNTGTVVDCQGWGEKVTTLGYGDLHQYPLDPTDARYWYTRSFQGTSSAAPMVAGAIACIQGALKAAGLAPLTSGDVRPLLRSLGSPQQPLSAGDRRRIGPRPDLKQLLPAAFQIATANKATVGGVG